MAVGQGDIARHPHNEHLGRSDMGVMAVRRLWARELKLLADGKPLTEWRRPDSLWSDLKAQG